MSDLHVLIGLTLLSEAVAVWLIARLWRSSDVLFFKISLTLLALIPLFGPLIVLWIGNFPSSKPAILRDMAPRRADFLTAGATFWTRDHPFSVSGAGRI